MSDSYYDDLAAKAEAGELTPIPGTVLRGEAAAGQKIVMEATGANTIKEAIQIALTGDDPKRVGAVETLNRWAVENGVFDAHSTLDDWNVSEFKDALVFTPSGQRRSNLVYLVRGDAVSAFPPSVVSFDEGYAQLVKSKGGSGD